MARQKAHLVSLPLQVVLYFCGWYLVLFYVAEISLIVYKALSLPYPSSNLAAEVILLAFLILLDSVRVFHGCKGNLTGRRLALLISLVFILPLVFGYLYLAIWQTYVLRIELVFISIALLGLLLEFILGVLRIGVLQMSHSTH